MTRQATLLGLAGLLLLAAATAPAAAQEDDSVVRLHVLFTADIHGYVDDFPAVWMNPNFPPPIGGGASAATYIKAVEARVKEQGEDVLLLDAGDCWQGSPVGTLTDGKVVTEYYNHLDYDLIAMGNHEFDKGWKHARGFSHSLDHKLVSCNTLDAETGELVDWVEPYRVFERSGLRIGVIGAITTGTANMAFEENIEGIEFAPIAPQARKYRRILEDEEDCDLVILVVHEGLPHESRFDEEWEEVQKEAEENEFFFEDAASGLELAHALPDIPVMIGGHTHQGYEEPWVDPYTHVIFFEPYARGTAVGHFVLSVDRDTGTVLDYETPERDSTLISLFEDQYWPDPEMKSLLEPYVESVEGQLKEVVGRTRNDLNRQGRSNNPMGNFVADGMRWRFDADLSFTNTGGLRTDLAAGDITLGDLQELMPFENALVVLDMPGSMIEEIFDMKSSFRSGGLYFSGARVVSDPRAEEGERVLSLEIGGEPIDLDATYRVVTTDYLLEGNSGYNLLTKLDADQIQWTEIMMRDAIAEYVRQNSPVSPRADDRYREEIGGPREDYLRGPASR